MKALQAGQDAQRRMEAKAAEREALAKARRQKQEALKSKVSLEGACRCGFEWQHGPGTRILKGLP